MMESVLILAVLGQRLEFRIADPERIRPEPSVSLRVRGGLHMTACRR